MSAAVPFGTLLAACEEIATKAARIDDAGPADLRLLARHLSDAADRVRLMASCAEADQIARRPPIPIRRVAA